MSRRELEALLKDSASSSEDLLKTRAMTSSRRVALTTLTASEVPGPNRSDCETHDAQEMESLCNKLAQAEREKQHLKAGWEELQKQVKFDQTELELNHLRAMEAQRQTSQQEMEAIWAEYRQQMEEQRAEIRAERKRTDSWIQGITELSQSEKRIFELQIKTLEDELHVLRQSQDSRRGTVSGLTSRQSTASSVSGSDGGDLDWCGLEVVAEHVGDLGVRDGRGSGLCGGDVNYGESGHVSEHASGQDGVGGAGRADGLGLTSARNLSTVPPGTRQHDCLAGRLQGIGNASQGREIGGGGGAGLAEGPGSTSAGGRQVSSSDNQSTVPPGTRQCLETVNPAARAVPGSSLLIESMSKLLQSQTEMLAAQAQAVAVQGLPSLQKFSGENLDSEEEGFDRWLETFEERAHLAGWTLAHQLYQLKLHLERTALQVFRIMPEDDKKMYSKAVTHLKERFRPVDIEELKGVEFHQRMQGKESIEQLGIDLQKLARKAFPGTTGKDFDRLLKGRFFQSLHAKWQRKLGAPKPSESFAALYDRARTLERHDKQFAESAAGREQKPSHASGERQAGTGRSTASTEQSRGHLQGNRASNTGSSGGTSSYRSRQSVECHKCKGMGHYARDCPSSGSRTEASGRSGTSRAATLVASSTESEENSLGGFTLEELEQHVAERKLSAEVALMEAAARETATVDMVVSDLEVSRVVGPTPYLGVTMEGVKTSALVDTGSQSTIISRSLLHQISRRLCTEGKELPKLVRPTVRLYGKDGQKGKRELNIVAQVELTVVADGKAVRVPMFVQPDSEQDCLLGMNAIPQLGLQVLRAGGSPLCVDVTQPETTARPSSESVSSVRLVEAATIPGRKGRFIDAVADTSFEERAEVLFEPDVDVLKDLGLSSTASLLTVGPGGKLLVPLQNLRQNVVDVCSQLGIGKVQVVEVDQVRPVSGTAGGCDVGEEGGEDVLVAGEESGEVNVVSCGDDRRRDLKKVLNLPQEGLEPRQVKQLEDLLLSSHDVFSLGDEDLGHTSLVTHKVDTGDHMPIKQPPRRLPFSQRETVSEMIEDMSKKGIVQPSKSAWASPIVLVPKRDKTLRFCVDYRKVNAVTKRDVYPLPRIDDILDTLGKSQYFTTLDLASGFWQIEMDPATREKTAFTSHCGLHEFRRMPFGMCNAPATFQRLMQVVLAGIEWKYCFVYLDDILVCSATFEEHLKHLMEVFERLRKACLTLKPVKCFFAQILVHYLGHMISRAGVSPDPEKTRKVREFPLPTDVARLRQFLGLTSYYRRFVAGFAAIAGPLHNLLKKDAEFVWSEECQVAFDTLREALTTAPVLVYPRFGAGEEFVLETDASLEGLGAVLSQKQANGRVHPVAYASRSLQVHEKNYSITELETLGLVWAVKHFRPYLLGHHTLVLTDHSACTSLLNAAKPSAKLARWAMIVQEFDLTIKHRSGRSNTNADALSRNPVPEASVLSVDGVDEDVLPVSSLDEAAELRGVELQEAQGKDLEVLTLIQYVKEGVVPGDEELVKRLALEGPQYGVIDGVLHHENPNQPGEWRIVVPVSLREGLLKEMHGGKFSGHFAWKKTYSTMRKKYWWRGMCGDVERFYRSCLECVTRKGPGRAVRPLLTTIPVGGPFHRVGVDVLQLPVTESGNKYVVVFMDYLTKWVEAFAVPDQSAVTIARLLVEEVFCRHGAPQHLLSDRGANFLSELVLEICSLLQIKKVNTSGYHPQTNGLVEKFNSTLIGMIAKVADSSGRDWDRHLPFLLFAYRVAIHDSTRESPFYLLYGRDARIPSEAVLEQEVSPYQVDVDDYRHDLTDSLSTAWALAKEHIVGAQERQKRAYDKGAKDHRFQVGDRVMIHMPGAVKGKAWKLARPYHGPYRVISVTLTNLEAQLIDDVDADPIFVAINRVRPCSPDLPDASWTGKKRRRGRRSHRAVGRRTSDAVPRARGSGPVTRSMAANAID